MREYKIKCNKCGEEMSAANVSTFQLCGEKFRPTGNMWRDNINKKLVDIELCEQCANVVYHKIYTFTKNFDMDIICPKDESRGDNEPYVKIGSNYIYSLQDIEDFILSNSGGFKISKFGHIKDALDNVIGLEVLVCTVDLTDCNKRIIEDLQDFKDLFTDYFPDTPIEYYGNR